MRVAVVEAKPVRRTRLGRAYKMEIWPIRGEQDYRRMRTAAEGLILREDLTDEEEARLDVMLVLLESYERQHHAIDVSDIGPIEILKHMLDEHGMNASDLGRLLGNRTLGSAILRGERQLSKAHIKKLCAKFGLGPEAFL